MALRNLSIAVAVLFAATPVVAQEEDAAAQETPEIQEEVSTEEAAAPTRDLSARYSDEQVAAYATAVDAAVKAESSSEVIPAIEGTGMSLEDYIALAADSRNDLELARRVADAVRINMGFQVERPAQPDEEESDAAEG